MIDTLSRLIRLQELKLGPVDLTRADDYELTELKSLVPESHQRRVYRFFDRGRKGVAPTRGTSCSGWDDGNCGGLIPCQLTLQPAWLLGRSAFF